MKHLLLLRHAKSSWDDDGLPDIERPLTPRGDRDARRIGKALGRRDPLPDLVLSSTARRARQTVAVVLRAAHLSLEPQFTPALYAASSDEILHLVRALPGACACALLVGHNPGFEELLGRLTGTAEPMPTAALACISLDNVYWRDVADGKGQLTDLLIPKQLDDVGKG
jgi:phosphohistidine phosphatase